MPRAAFGGDIPPDRAVPIATGLIEGPSAVVLDEWLRAVLAAWRVLFRMRVSVMGWVSARAAIPVLNSQAPKSDHPG